MAFNGTNIVLIFNASKDLQNFLIAIIEYPQHFTDLCDMDKQERNVVHLELNGQHYYYGNIKALTDNWDRDTLGVSYNYLKNYGLSESHPYKGKKCIIRKGTLITSPHKK